MSRVLLLSFSISFSINKVNHIAAADIFIAIGRTPQQCVTCLPLPLLPSTFLCFLVSIEQSHPLIHRHTHTNDRTKHANAIHTIRFKRPSTVPPCSEAQRESSLNLPRARKAPPVEWIEFIHKFPLNTNHRRLGLRFALLRAVTTSTTFSHPWVAHHSPSKEWRSSTILRTNFSLPR